MLDFFLFPSLQQMTPSWPLITNAKFVFTLVWLGRFNDLCGSSNVLTSRATRTGHLVYS